MNNTKTIKNTRETRIIPEDYYTKILINMMNMYTRLHDDRNNLIDSDDYSIEYSITDSDYSSDSYTYKSESSGSYDYNNSSDCSSVSSDEDSCFRRTRRKERNRLNISNIYMEYGQTFDINYGYTTDINKENPIISYMIDKRISNCRVGPSSHIAAFLPSNIDIGSCFISGYRKKGDYW